MGNIMSEFEEQFSELVAEIRSQSDWRLEHQFDDEKHYEILTKAIMKTCRDNKHIREAFEKAKTLEDGALGPEDNASVSSVKDFVFEELNL